MPKVSSLHERLPSVKNMTDAQLASLAPFRGRGLGKLQERVGDIVPLIEARLARRTPVRLLEVGAGFGRVLVELRQRYGTRVELHAINKRKSHGDWPDMQRNALNQGLATAAELGDMVPPELHFVNVGDGLPFPDGRFDLVYSQVSFPYYENKAGFLEDVNRVLDSDGIARIDVRIRNERIPGPYSESFEIWDGGRRVSFWDHIRPIRGLRRRKTLKGWYLEMTKSHTLNLGLDLRHVVPLNEICADWWGNKSVYAVARAAKEPDTET